MRRQQLKPQQSNIKHLKPHIYGIAVESSPVAEALVIEGSEGELQQLSPNQQLKTQLLKAHRGNHNSWASTAEVSVAETTAAEASADQ